MDLNRTSLIFIMILLAISTRGLGQQLELGINLLAGIAHTRAWEAGMNGSSLNFDYLHAVTERTRLKGGLELGYTAWGSQGIMDLGIRYGGINAMEINILNGMAFYQQGPNYVFGTGACYTRSFFNRGKNLLLLSIGLRYTVQNAYREYSPIYSYFDLPVKIRWGRKLHQN